MKRKDIRKLIEVFDLFREVAPDANVSRILALLMVMEKGDVTGRDIERRLKVPSASAGRHLRYWDVTRRGSEKGVGFIQMIVDEDHYPSRIRRLTPEGEEFAKRLKKCWKKLGD